MPIKFSEILFQTASCTFTVALKRNITFKWIRQYLKEQGDSWPELLCNLK